MANAFSSPSLEWTARLTAASSDESALRRKMPGKARDGAVGGGRRRRRGDGRGLAATGRRRARGARRSVCARTFLLQPVGHGAERPPELDEHLRHHQPAAGVGQLRIAQSRAEAGRLGLARLLRRRHLPRRPLRFPRLVPSRESRQRAHPPLALQPIRRHQLDCARGLRRLQVLHVDVKAPHVLAPRHLGDILQRQHAAHLPVVLRRVVDDVRLRQLKPASLPDPHLAGQEGLRALLLQGAVHEDQLEVAAVGRRASRSLRAARERELLAHGGARPAMRLGRALAPRP